MDAIGWLSLYTYTVYQRWAGPQLVPLFAIPQLAEQGNLLRKCAVICRQLTAELRLRTKKYSKAADLTSTMRNSEERERERESCLLVGSLKMNTTLEYSTRVVQEGDRRCKKRTLNDLAYLTPLSIPLMNPLFLSF